MKRLDESGNYEKRVEKLKDLFKDVCETKTNEIQKKLPIWQDSFSKIWEGTGEQWEELIGFLPIPDKIDFDIKEFNKFCYPGKNLKISLLAFFNRIAFDVLDLFRWQDQHEEKALRLLIGTLNLYGFTNQSNSKILKERIANIRKFTINTIKRYPLTLIRLILKFPEDIKVNGQQIDIGQIISIDSEILKIQLNDIDEYFCESMVVLFDEFVNRDHGYNKKLIGSSHILIDPEIMIGLLVNQETITKNLKNLLQINNETASRILRFVIEKHRNWLRIEIIDEWLEINENLAESDEYILLIESCLKIQEFWKKESFIRLLNLYPFPSEKISMLFYEKFSTLEKHNFFENGKKIYELWVKYLPLRHYFLFYWNYLFNTDKDDKPRFEETFEERINTINSSIQSANKFFHRGNEKTGWDNIYRASKVWMHIFTAIGSLIDNREYSYYRRKVEYLEEIWIRQKEAIETLNENQYLIPDFSNGVLDFSMKYWNLLDPIMLGLDVKETEKCLEEYILKNEPQEKYYHAKLLLAHLRGILIPEKRIHSYQNNTLDVVETLFKASNSKISKRRSRIWLGDYYTENLWFGSIKTAIKEFTQSDFDQSYNELDEHRFVHSLLKSLESNLNQLNQVVTSQLISRSNIKGFIDVSVREFAPRAKNTIPQEGGTRGTQADFAFLIKIDLPDLIISDRVTFVQVKNASKSNRNKTSLSLSTDECGQLDLALEKSEHFYYLFLYDSASNQDHLILPAKTLKEILLSQKKKIIPMSMIYNSSEILPNFIFYDIIGLWTGDRRREIIDEVYRGSDLQGVGPRYVIDIRISTKEQNG